MDKLPYTIAIDFDGTLCEDKFPEIGAPNRCLISLLVEYKKMNPNIRYILWTCRDNHTAERHLDKAVAWCKEHGLEFDAVNENLPEVKAMFDNDTRKVFANRYLDDKNISIKDMEWVIAVGLDDDFALDGAMREAEHYA